MKCPECDSKKLKITDSRPVEAATRRKRLCEECGHRWHTFEFTMTQEEYKLFVLRSKRQKMKFANWTEEEDELLVMYLGEGCSHSTIAKFLGRTKYSVRGRVKKLGLEARWVVTGIENRQI